MAEFTVKSDDGRALFYSPTIGKHRVYRQGISDSGKGLKLLTYKRKSSAESICSQVNKAYNDKFKVSENQ